MSTTSRTLNFKKIEEGLERVRALGHLEDTFLVMGISITLRTLRRGEMEAANRYCLPLFEEAQERDDAFSLTSWVQAVKQESLCYAIMAIGHIDFHGIDFVSTGEIDPDSGKELRVQKHVFVRGILEEWEESVTETVYRKFQELTNRAADKASEGVTFREKAETEVRIQELETELAELRERLKKSEKESTHEGTSSQSNIDVDSIKEQIFSPASEEEFVYAETQEGEVSEPEPEPEPEPEQEDLGPSYVGEDQKPLEGHALEVAQENERLYQERALQRQRAARVRGRQPLNQVDARTIRQPQPQKNPQEGQGQGQGQAQAQAQEGTPQNVEYLTKEEPLGQEGIRVNPDPVISGNPRYQPTHKR